VADSSISLNDLFDRMFHDSLNPVPLDHRAIWSQAHRLKVLCESHGRSFTRPNFVKRFDL